MGSIEEINIKSRTYSFLMTYSRLNKGFNPDLLKIVKIDKISYKNIDIYYFGYIAMKDFDYVKINSVNPFYLIISKADGYIEESNRNKYLTLVSTDKNKEVLEKYTELWGEINYQIKTINCGKPGEYEKLIL